MKRVLVTREAGAGLLTAKLYQGLGYNAVLHPLIKIEPVSLILLPSPLDFDYLIITSFNAANIMASPSHKDFSRVPVLIVGSKSADYLHNCGFKVAGIYQDSNELIEGIVDLGRSNLKLLYLSGDYVSTDIVGQLKIHGHYTKQIVVYRSVKAKDIDVNLLKSIDIVTFYSQRTAAIFVEMVTSLGYDSFQNIVCLALSAAIAQQLHDLSFKYLRVASEPNETAMLELLKAISSD